MSLSKIDQILIEKYLDKSLTDAEQITFNQRLEEPNFAAEVDLYQQSVQAVCAFGDAQLKAILMEEEAKLEVQTAVSVLQYGNTFVPKIPQKLVIRYWIALAASFLLLVSVGYWFLTNKDIGIDIQKKNNILASNFKPYPNFNDPNVRDNTNTKTDREKAYTLYDNGEYEQALTYFQKITPPQYKDQFFEANAYLATHQAGKAAPLFERLSQNPSFEWQKQAEWYWALSLLTTKPEQAKRLFEKIKVDNQHPFYKNAVQMPSF